MINNKKGKATILLYHQVGRKPTNQSNLDCYCDQNRFEEQMAFLNNSDYKVIDLETLVNNISDKVKKFNEDYVVLTFDDGCEKFLETAYPILRKYDFPATIYPVAGCLGKIATWPNINNPDLKIISKLALKNLSENGVNIGAHTMNHIKLTTCSIETARKEIENSKKTLETVLDKEINSFSYPHGDFNKEIKEIVQECGFTSGVTCKSNFTKVDSDLLELPRKYITYFDTLESFKNILENEL